MLAAMIVLPALITALGVGAIIATNVNSVAITGDLIGGNASGAGGDPARREGDHADEEGDGGPDGGSSGPGDDGRIDLDTNPVERAIRPVALGRKNALFAGSDGGAGRWAQPAPGGA